MGLLEWVRGGGVRPAHRAHGPSLCPQLEQGLFCGWVAPLEGPVGAVLECLVHTSRALEEQLARPVLYLVDLLTGEPLLGRGRSGQDAGFSSWAFCTLLTSSLLPGLNETQLKLLTKVLETGELSRPFKLVREHRWQGEGAAVLRGPRCSRMECCGRVLDAGAAGEELLTDKPPPCPTRCRAFWSRAPPGRSAGLCPCHRGSWTAAGTQRHLPGSCWRSAASSCRWTTPRCAGSQGPGTTRVHSTPVWHCCYA